MAATEMDPHERAVQLHKERRSATFWYREIGLPQHLWKLDFEDFDLDRELVEVQRARKAGHPFSEQDRAAVEAARQALEEARVAAEDLDAAMESGEHEGKGLTLLGPPGRGKTLLAVIIAKRHLLRNPAQKFGVSWWDYEPPVKFMPLANFQALLFEEFRLERRDDLDDEWFNLHKKINYLREVELLVVDDVGKERASRTEHIESEFDRLIRDRYNVGYPTVLTSNLSIDGIHRRYNLSLASFLHESSEIVELPGLDLRRRK